MKERSSNEIINVENRELVSQPNSEQILPSNLKAKFQEAKHWALDNPIQATGLTLVSLLFLRTRLTRKALYWAATTVASSELLGVLGNSFKDEVAKSKNLDETSELH